jgi:hypothetical protein
VGRAIRVVEQAPDAAASACFIPLWEHLRDGGGPPRRGIA